MTDTAKGIDALSVAYEELGLEMGFPLDCDAQEALMGDDLTPKQRRVISAFVRLWDAYDAD
jgi:hypothetical protein